MIGVAPLRFCSEQKLFLHDTTSEHLLTILLDQSNTTLLINTSFACDAVIVFTRNAATSLEFYVRKLLLLFFFGQA